MKCDLAENGTFRWGAQPPRVNFTSRTFQILGPENIFSAGRRPAAENISAEIFLGRPKAGRTKYFPELFEKTFRKFSSGRPELPGTFEKYF